MYNREHSGAIRYEQSGIAFKHFILHVTLFNLKLVSTLLSFFTPTHALSHTTMY
jgi:hypothetical protein